MTTDELRRRLVEWIALDPDPDDEEALVGLLNNLDEGRDTDALEQLFSAPELNFGTAGLRGPMQPGPGGMNRANVRFATLGVLGWMKETGLDPSKGVVVGRDGRRNSESFNDEVVRVLLGGGVRVFEMPGPLPTPLVAYCVKALSAAAGIMVTASHNPPNDNGYKLYASDGAQIIPPDDEIVERHMRLAITNALGDRGARDVLDASLGDRSSSLHSYIADSVLGDYRAHLAERFGVPKGEELAITYTPLHGVGGVPMTQLFAEAGYVNVTTVAGQFEPDGSFPTLPFPNPEEPGALDLSIETARAANAAVILANDPDADRLGAAIRVDDDWRVLRGDEIGWLLASSLVEGIRERGETMATTIVSSTLLEKMAKEHGVPFATTLTGFKWLARAAGDGVLGFGYEEALGFAVDPGVSDKDGMSAALALARLDWELTARGSSLVGRLDEIEAAYGVHLTTQLAIRADGADGLAQLRQKVTELTEHPPTVLGPCEVTEWADLGKGFRGLRPTDGVWLQLGATGRVVVRPSGTEAKVKAYIEITPPRVDSLEAERAHAHEVTNGVLESLRELLSV
ncbi:MAG: phospho-sugar mutase [Acidimicrobiales bacterium]